MARSEWGASPHRAGTSERRSQPRKRSGPTALLPRALQGCVDFGVGLRCSLGRDRWGYRRCARALTSAKIDRTAIWPTLSIISYLFLRELQCEVLKNVIGKREPIIRASRNSGGTGCQCCSRRSLPTTAQRLATTL